MEGGSNLDSLRFLGVVVLGDFFLSLFGEALLLDWRTFLSVDGDGGDLLLLRLRLGVVDGGGGGGGGASLFANGCPADAAFVLEEGVGKRLVLTSGRGGDDWAALPFVLLFSIFRLTIPGAGMLDFRTGVDRRGSISLFSFQ